MTFRKPVLSVAFRAMPPWFCFIFTIGYKPLEKAKFFLYSVWSRTCSVISFIDIKAVSIKIRKLNKPFCERVADNFHDQRNMFVVKLFDRYIVILLTAHNMRSP